MSLPAKIVGYLGGIFGIKKIGATTLAFALGLGSPSGANGVIFGNGAGALLTTGARNTLVGDSAGDTLTTGADCTCLGQGSDVSAAGASFQTAIGAGAVCTADNQVRLGRATETVSVPGPLTGSGLITGTLGLTITGAAVSLNASSNFATSINTGTSTGAVTIGNSAAGIITIANKANTAATFLVTDGTTNYYAVDTRTGVTGVTTHSFSGTGMSFAGAAGNTYSMVGIPAFTFTQTGSTGVTALGGLSLLIGSPTVTDAAALTVTTASAVLINGPLPAGSITFTNSFGLDLPTFATNGTTAAALRVVAPTGATNNYAMIVGVAPNPADTAALAMFTPPAATAAVVFNTSSTQPFVIRQIGGVAGTDELRVAHDGTNVLYDNRNAASPHFFYTNGVLLGGFLDAGSGAGAVSLYTGGVLYAQLKAISGGGSQLILGANGQVTSGSGGGGGVDVGLQRTAASVWQVTNGSTGTGWLQNTAGEAALESDFTSVDATMTNTALSVTLIAGRSYRIEGVLIIRNSTATDGIKFDFNGGTATITTFFAGFTAIGSVTVGTVVSELLDTDLTATVVTGTDMLIIRGYIEVLAAGTFILRAAEQTDGGGTLTVQAGSWMALYDTVDK